MQTIVVYTPQTSNRLRYIADWLFVERLRLNYRFTSDKNDLINLPFFISYTISLSGAVSIPAAGLVFEQGANRVEPRIGTWQEIPTIFHADANGFTIPFDLFSAIFYLLSRYEEYYPFTPDKHGRYPATESILYKNDWLLRPVIDEWVFEFRKLLIETFQLQLPALQFIFQPTYDIDIAYSHLYKGIKRIAGAYFRSLLEGNILHITERTRVLKRKERDPYDSFQWLHELHQKINEMPKYFILSALGTTPFDKNIHPSHPAMTRLIRQMVKDGEIGIHPSYFSEERDLLNKEKIVLEQVSSLNIHISRQHYIKFKIPGTYWLLIKNGISDDYSMGYGTMPGFRAGTGSSFSWFDLENENNTSLCLHPFCFMDTMLHYEEQLNPENAFMILDLMTKTLKKTGSTVTTIFHNFSLGTANEWHGWRKGYEEFVLNTTSK